MIISLANLVFGGRGRDSEDIVVLCFLHHCGSLVGFRSCEGRRKGEPKRRERVGYSVFTRKCGLYSSDSAILYITGNAFSREKNSFLSPSPLSVPASLIIIIFIHIQKMEKELAFRSCQWALAYFNGFHSQLYLLGFSIVLFIIYFIFTTFY